MSWSAEIHPVKRNRMDAAYVDKLDGKISEEFWTARQASCGSTSSGSSLRSMVLRPLITATAPLMRKPDSLYISQDSFEKAKLLRMLLSSCLDASKARCFTIWQCSGNWTSSLASRKVLCQISYDCR